MRRCCSIGLRGVAAAAATFTTVAFTDTTPYSWGWGQFGQLGHGREADEAAPLPIEYLQRNAVTALRSHGTATSTAALDGAGRVYTFGCGKDSRLGHGYHVDAPNQNIPRAVEGIDGEVAEVAVGEYHMAALTKDGRVWTWGKERAGQLGHANSNKGYPNLVEALSGEVVTAVSCGRQHTVALTQSGNVYTWGQGYDGALGLGGKNNEKTPKLVEGLQGKAIVSVSAGRDHTLFVTTTGEVYTCGSDDSGQQGQGFAHRYERSPVLVKGLKGKKVVKVSAGEFHNAAVTDNGEVYTWGCGAMGQLGHGDRSDLGLPRFVEAFHGMKVVDVAAGGSHTLFLTDKGHLYAVGKGRNGQLGRGDQLESVAAYRTKPVDVHALSGKKITQIAAGSDHSLALVE